jgi:hypothetical protein
VTSRKSAVETTSYAPRVRLGSASHLAVSSIAVAVPVVLLGAPSVAALNRHRTIALRLSVTGVGTVRVSGSKSFTCRAAFCRHTFRVRLGQRLTLGASPASGWKLATWAGACNGTAASCALRLRETARVSVTFVPPGDRLNPYPLGTSVKLDGGWRLTVNSAIIDANPQVEAVTDQHGHPLNPPPPAGAQYALVNVSLTFVAGGSSGVSAYVDYWLGAEGARKAQYQLACTPPPLDLSAVLDPVDSGQTVTGNLCFEIASGDASTLKLFGTVTTPDDSYRFAYFALR